MCHRSSVRLPEGDGPQALAFPLVGVAAARRGGETTVALAGVAPIPWLLDGLVGRCTPLPGTAYKVEIAAALVRRALAAVA